MITYKKDKQYLLLHNFQKQNCRGKNAKIFELRNHTHVEETSNEFCLVDKTTGAAWRAVSSIYQIAHPERDIYCAAFF